MSSWRRSGLSLKLFASQSAFCWQISIFQVRDVKRQKPSKSPLFRWNFWVPVHRSTYLGSSYVELLFRVSCCMRPAFLLSVKIPKIQWLIRMRRRYFNASKSCWSLSNSSCISGWFGLTRVESPEHFQVHPHGSGNDWSTWVGVRRGNATQTDIQIWRRCKWHQG